MRVLVPALVAIAGLVLADVCPAQAKYDPGASDTEIKVGNTTPYSGPASAFGLLGKAAAGYFEHVNAGGGVNGRKIRFITLDDGWSPPKTVEQTRKLVDEEKVLLLCCAAGTAPQLAAQKLLNSRKVPQLFIGSGASQFSDPSRNPWSMGFLPSYRTEGRILARHVLQTVKDPKVAFSFQNDDASKEFIRGFKEQLGDRAATVIVKEASHETTDATIDSQLISARAAEANVLVTISAPKFAAMAIRKIHDLNWKPLHILFAASASITGALQPAGLDKSTGIVSAVYMKDPNDPAWQGDPGMDTYKDFAKTYLPGVDSSDFAARLGYTMAQTLVEVLKTSGDDLTRENVMRQAAQLKGLKLPLLIPGIEINTGATDFVAIEQLQLMRFNGATWERFGEIMSE